MSDSLSIPSFKFLLLHIELNEKVNTLMDYNHLPDSIKGKKKKGEKTKYIDKKTI